METVYIIGQAVLGLFFVKSGLMHFMKMDMMLQYAEQRKLPAPKLAIAVTGLMLLAGGLSVLTGMYLEHGLWLLVAFLVLTSLKLHAFWSMKDASEKMNNMHFFMGNIALTAALLMLMSMTASWPWVLGA